MNNQENYIIDKKTVFDEENDEKYCMLSNVIQKVIFSYCLRGNNSILIRQKLFQNLHSKSLLVGN